RTLKSSSVDAQSLFSDAYYSDRFGQPGPLETFITPDQLNSIINSTTRQITEFGSHYQNQPNSIAAQMARESDDEYSLITDKLYQLFKEQSEANLQEAQEPTLD